MADIAGFPIASSAIASETPRHSSLVRVTHWIATLCFLALLVSGLELVISHPRFYWGEAGTVLTPPLFHLPIPASRSTVPTGYNYVLPDQNGWSRYLHFQTAWIAVITGLIYVLYILFTGHLRKPDFSWQAISSSITTHLRFKPDEESSYNVLQQLSYLFVIFILSPLVVWTGLAMSPAVAAAFPFTVTAFGGQQSARTIHFFVTLLFVAFLLIHVLMISISGFRNRMRAMITGPTSKDKA